MVNFYKISTPSYNEHKLITYMANLEISVKFAKFSPELERTVSDPDDGFAQFEDSLECDP